MFLKVVICCLEYASAVAKTFFMSDCVVVEIKEPESAFPAGKPMDNSGLSVFFSIQPSDTFSMKDSGSLISVMMMYQKHCR